VMFFKLRNLPVHESMREVSELIYETCKTYLITQGKFILLLELFIGAVMVIYFGWLSEKEPGVPYTPLEVGIIVLFSLIGIAGSYGVAWFGIRINTYANSRCAFASLGGKPYPIYAIPLQAGISIGTLLITVELAIMLSICCLCRASLPGRASSASPSVNRSVRPHCGSPAASSRKSPTSAPT
jgi:K(+)-stimulated pyrophosphate-energized sodium pump